MSEFINAFFWAVVGIALDKFFDRFLYPTYVSYLKEKNAKEKEELYLGKKTQDFIYKYYSKATSGYLANCRIGNTSMCIPFLIENGWDNLNIDLLEHNNTLQFVKTEDCSYPIRKKTIKFRKKIGQTLFNDESLFLHNIEFENNSITIEAGTYCYFQRLSFFSDFEKETYHCSLNPWKKSRMRDEYLPNTYIGAHGAKNAIPVGCDVALLIKVSNDFLIALHHRSPKTANYPNTTMVVPSFGLGDITHVKGNPLLFSFLKEYCEEVFDRDELVQSDAHSSPEWFYDAYDEAKDIQTLIQKNKFFLTLLGCGFDAIGGYFNLSLLAIIDDEDTSKKILLRSKGNWETDKSNGNALRFIPLVSSEIEELLNYRRISPSSAYTISLARKYIDKIRI